MRSNSLQTHLRGRRGVQWVVVVTARHARSGCSHARQVVFLSTLTSDFLRHWVVLARLRLRHVFPHPSVAFDSQSRGGWSSQSHSSYPRWMRKPVTQYAASAKRAQNGTSCLESLVSLSRLSMPSHIGQVTASQILQVDAVSSIDRDD